MLDDVEYKIVDFQTNQSIVNDIYLCYKYNTTSLLGLDLPLYSIAKYIAPQGAKVAMSRFNKIQCKTKELENV